MEKEKSKKNTVLQRRPAPVLYFLVATYLKIANRLKYNLHVTGENIKGPALIITNHSSNLDYKLIVSAAYPNRVSFLCTYHFFTFKKLKFWLNRIGAIPKYQFSIDIACLSKIKYILQKKKGIVYIAPEGTVYSSGELGLISPAIAKLIKMLKVPVYSSVILGAGLGNAKWSRFNHRGKINIDTHLLFTEEDVKTLSVGEMMDKINKSLSFSDFDYQKKESVVVNGNNKALGFETMFYKCPCCKKEFTLKTENNTVTCTSCGTKAEFTDNFTFKWQGRKQYFNNYTQWYNWQLEEMRNAVSKEDFCIKELVDIGQDFPGVNNYVKTGRGTITLSHDGWIYEGTRNGEPYRLFYDVSEVFIATLKVGLHFELPVKDDHCQVFYPVEGGNRAMKWHLASRAMTEFYLNKEN